MITRATLSRWASTPFGVFAWLDLFDATGARVARFPTAEDDWLNNAPGKSCIVAGSYLCRRKVSPKFGETFEVTGVPGRSAILFHGGNTEEDTQGCVLLGSALGSLTVPDEDDAIHRAISKWAVVGSKIARAKFMAALVGVQSFPLVVRWALPEEGQP